MSRQMPSPSGSAPPGAGRLLLALLLALAAMLLTFESVRAAAGRASPAPRVVTVVITGGRFVPSQITVDPGTVVRWVNRDRVAHSTTGGMVCVAPPCDGAWDSGPLARGASFQRAFDVPGRWAYGSSANHAVRGEVVVREPPPPEGRCTGWSARYDRQRGGVVLLVTGRCEFPSTGYRARLRPAEPQGINDRILLLDLVATPPNGPAATVMTTQVVTYRQALPRPQYEQVTILPAGDTVAVRQPRR